MIPATQLVRDTCSFVVKNATHVSIDQEATKNLARKFVDDIKNGTIRCGPEQWSCDYHLSYEDCCKVFKEKGISDPTFSPEDAAVHFCLVVDTINFCFWPLENLEYAQMARGIKNAFLKDYNNLKAQTLEKMTPELLCEWIGAPVPNAEERSRFLREVGVVLCGCGGRGGVLVGGTHGAAALVRLITDSFTNFRDHSVYKGRQIFFYKRAQILVGDIWGSFCGKGLGEFKDIDDLTMFADYRVPQSLESLGVMKYTDELKKKIAEKKEIPPSSEEEIEIRATVVVAVEQLRDQIEKIAAQEGEQIPKLSSVEIDWALWNYGEERLAVLPPHHRTLSIYY